MYVCIYIYIYTHTYVYVYDKLVCQDPALVSPSLWPRSPFEGGGGHGNTHISHTISHTQSIYLNITYQYHIHNSTYSISRRSWQHTISHINITYTINLTSEVYALYIAI